MRFKNLVRTLKNCGVLFLETDYFDVYFLAGIDSLVHLDSDTGCTLLRNEILKAIDLDSDLADDALSKLMTYASEHPAFLFAREKSFEKLLVQLDLRASAWNTLCFEEQEELLAGFVRFSI